MSERLVSMVAESKADFDTRDSFLLCALMAVGVRPCSTERVRVITPEHVGGARYQYFLEPRSECGKYDTGKLIVAWKEGLPWIEKNPDHPFAYAMAAALNFKANAEFLNFRSPSVFLTAGKSVALIPLNASAELEEKILGRFNP
jgi:hypothetical protein